MLRDEKRYRQKSLTFQSRRTSIWQRSGIGVKENDEGLLRKKVCAEIFCRDLKT